MIIYYHSDSGHVFSMHDGFTALRTPLASNESILLLPDSKEAYGSYTRGEGVVSNGNYLANGQSLFSFGEVQTYYRELLNTMFQGKLNQFGLLQLQKIQILRQMHENGDTITYPQNFYRLGNGALFQVTDLATLAQVETYLLSEGLSHINNRLAKYSTIKAAIEAASTVAELTDINFFA